jgi:hypothetical protein
MYGKTIILSCLWYDYDSRFLTIIEQNEVVSEQDAEEYIGPKREEN